MLVNDGHGLFLTTDKYYGDFELRLEYKTVPGADSGIYLRGIPQVQIWDPAGGERNVVGSGGLDNNGDPVTANGAVTQHRGVELDLEWQPLPAIGGRLDVAALGGACGVDVDRNEGLGVVDHDRAARR